MSLIISIILIIISISLKTDSWDWLDTLWNGFLFISIAFLAITSPILSMIYIFDNMFREDFPSGIIFLIITICEIVALIYFHIKNQKD